MKGILSNSRSYSDENLVVFYIQNWERYTVGSKFLNNIFAYINRHWVKREREEGHRDIYDISTLCLVRWKQDLFDDIHSRLIEAVLVLINKERDGETINTQNIKKIVQSCVTLGLDENNSKRTSFHVYRKYFEEPFISNTARYYAKESQEFLSSKGVVEYLKKATIRLNEESTRIQTFLRTESAEPLRKVCVEVLVKKHAPVIQDEFLSLLREDRESDLNLMFSLLEKVEGGLEPLQLKLENYVHDQGTSAVSQLYAESNGNVDNSAFVSTLLKVHNKYTRLVQVAFKGHTEMGKALDNACRKYINHNAVTQTSVKGRTLKTPELLARYSDSLLKKSSKNSEVSDIDSALNGVMTIFQYVDEKDVFERVYSRMLARRLVHGNSLSMDAETNMVTKIKDICGSEYTNKLQRMFQDMAVSEEMQSQFKEHLETTGVKPVGEFTPYVLADAYWPLPHFTSNFKLPNELLPIRDKFASYYNQKHTGRKLQWLWNLSKGELKGNFSKHSKIGFTFQVSIIQMAILLPYNNQLEYTYEQLQEITMLDDDLLKGSLSILLKARVLINSSSSRPTSKTAKAKPKTAEDGNEMDVDDSSTSATVSTSSGVDKARKSGAGDDDDNDDNFKNHTFRLNPDFKSKKVRINLNLPLKSEQKKEADDTQKSINDDRSMFLNACIVRIMKARRKLSHVGLMQETVEQAQKRFNPDVRQIKRCIEELIEKEFIQRLDDKTYEYLA